MEYPLASLVIDTSVALKWYVEKDEADVHKAHELLDCIGLGQCSAKSPQLLFFEIANTLSIARKLQRATVMAALTHLRDLHLDIRPLEWRTFSRAVEVAADCDATIYDSYFLALALETGSVLVTADEAFLKKARRYPDVIHLRQLRLADVNP